MEEAEKIELIKKARQIGMSRLTLEEELDKIGYVIRYDGNGNPVAIEEYTEEDILTI